MTLFEFLYLLGSGDPMKLDRYLHITAACLDCVFIRLFKTCSQSARPLTLGEQFGLISAPSFALLLWMHSLDVR